MDWLVWDVAKRGGCWQAVPCRGGELKGLWFGSLWMKLENLWHPARSLSLSFLVQFSFYLSVSLLSFSSLCFINWSISLTSSQTANVISLLCPLLQKPGQEDCFFCLSGSQFCVCVCVCVCACVCVCVCVCRLH